MSTYNILVVDDIFTNRLLLRESVKLLCDNYYEAKNGKEAIEILEANPIDIILMDIEMPIMNGLETTKYIREKTVLSKRNVPIIALTAHNPNNFFEEYEDAGFDELMTKPYSIEKIRKKITSLSK